MDHHEVCESRSSGDLVIDSHYLYNCKFTG